MNPALHEGVSRVRGTGVFAWLLEWGVFAGVGSVSRIEDSLHVLWRQSQLRDEQVKWLARYLGLTVHWVDGRGGVLYELDAKLLILNKTLQNLMWTVDAVQCPVSSVLHCFQAGVCHVCALLYALCGDIDSLFEYMRILATWELGPAVIPPDILKTMLHRVGDGIGSDAGLELCGDPGMNIWSYYGTMG